MARTSHDSLGFDGDATTFGLRGVQAIGGELLACAKRRDGAARSVNENHAATAEHDDSWRLDFRDVRHVLFHKAVSERGSSATSVVSHEPAFPATAPRQSAWSSKGSPPLLFAL
jgi:hypothetical protein